jgi:alpha-L-fucosidase
MSKRVYEPYWNSLRLHPVPRWLDDGKFGIYTHWGVYSVPACGPNGSWYPHNMYREGTQQYEYHIQHYGHPSKFGYKDFIPMFKAEKFNPDEWAELFKAAGARFAGPVAEHHDGFSMWNSDINEWNAACMGPQRDIVGELEKSIRKRGIKFMVAFHHAENWWYYPHWRKEFDVSDRKYSGLYGPIHNQDVTSDLKWEDQDPPNKEFLEKWKEKIREVIDKYRPDLIWFDFGLQFIPEKYKREIIAYYFNKALEWNMDVTICYKGHSVPPEIGIVDYELGRESELTYHRWITDTDIAIGGRWSYVYGIEYKSTTWLIHYLIDNVSKNGYLLLNVGPKANGEIPEQAKQRLLEMGEWLKLNGEAIYGTSSWVIYGEGPTKMTLRGTLSEEAEVFYTAEDIRFTVKNNVLYAILLGWPGEGKEITIRSLRVLYPGEVHSVSMLGIDGELKWSQSKEGLKIKMPNEKPCEHAYVIKIERE